MSHSYIFYGVDAYAENNLYRWWKMGFIPVCLADAHATRHDKKMRYKTPKAAEFDILPLRKALAQNPHAHVYITIDQNANPAVYQEIRSSVIAQGVPPRRVGPVPETAPDKPGIFFGAGMRASLNLEDWVSNGIIPLCFADNDERKHCAKMRVNAAQIDDELEILPLREALERYPDAFICITSRPETYDVARDGLLLNGVPAGRIVALPRLGKDEFKRYESCQSIEDTNLCFIGSMDAGNQCVTTCCEPIQGRPGIAFDETPENTMKNFFMLHRDVKQEFRAFSGEGGDPPNKRRFTSGCAKCACMQMRDWPQKSERIHVINLSMYPAPCQCKCIYCGSLRRGDTRLNQTIHPQYYENLFDTLEYALSAKMVVPDVQWLVASGEITIHPYRDRIFDLINGGRAIFFTNAFIFDKRIAENLNQNPKSRISLSIDSGTPETWRKVKGVNNFDAVIGNLCQYCKNCEWPEIFHLKYILLPGVNDDPADCYALVEIMKKLGAKHLTLSCDVSKKYVSEEEGRKILIRAAGHFAAILTKNHLSYDAFNYTSSESEQIAQYANRLLRENRV